MCAPQLPVTATECLRSLKKKRGVLGSSFQRVHSQSPLWACDKARHPGVERVSVFLSLHDGQEAEVGWGVPSIPSSSQP